MSNQHGGYREPRNPAPASGPGRLSKRTDGQPGQRLMAPTGMQYGERQSLMAQERLGAMAQSPNVPTANVPPGPQGAGGAAPQMTPFDAPTARPDEPITSGSPIGPGPTGLSFPTQAQPAAGSGALTDVLRRLSATDSTGILGRLMVAAEARNA